MKKSEEKVVKVRLNQLVAKYKDADFGFFYGIKKNFTSLNQSLNELDETEKEARKIIKDYDAEFEKERNQLITKLGTDTENGGKEIKPDSENWGKWVKAITKIQSDLEKKYEKELAEFNTKWNEQINPILEKEGTYTPYHIEQKVCPKLNWDEISYLMEVGIIE